MANKTKGPARSTYECNRCGAPFVARTADRARGWARFCSKSCKAIDQTQRTEYAGPQEERHEFDDIPFLGYGDLD